MDNNEPILIPNDLIFSWHSLTYTETDDYDIFYHLGSPIDDFVILHQRAFNETLNETEINAYDQLFNILNDIADSQYISIGDTFNYTSAEINEFAKNINQSLSINDIVTFNNFKDVKESLETTSTAISKSLYYELRTDQTLTDEQYNNIELLQNYFIKLYYEYNLTDISRYSYDYIEEQCLSLDDYPTQDELISLENGYLLLMTLSL
jgi:hypothetical protein